MKKLIAGISAFVMALSVGGFASAEGWFGGDSYVYVSENQNANINTAVENKSDTGDNSVNTFNGGKKGSVRTVAGINTGDAVSQTEILVGANSRTTHIDGCGCLQNGDSKIKVYGSQNANVNTAVSNKADTGDNKINTFGGSYYGSNRTVGLINTGDAHAVVGVGVLVNESTTIVE
jgi:hypothetical protein